MRASPLFSKLEENERRQLLPSFAPQMLAKGEHLLNQGQENDCLFVLASGEFEVRDGDHVLGSLAIGDGIGELSLLGRKPAGADVIATQPSVVLKLSRDDFDKVAVKHPQVLAEVYKLLLEREKKNLLSVVHDAQDLIL
jgi:CRP-like cAMP-binding protein